MPILRNKLTKTYKVAQRLQEEEDAIKIEHCEDEENMQKNNQSKTEKNTSMGLIKQEEKSSQDTSDSLSRARKTANSAKNIVKNFGRAMITFAISKLALPYLEKLLIQEELDFKDFKKYLYDRKERMDGISSLRALILVEKNDDKEIASIKRTFQYICEIFIKYFSVNWIFHSKLGDKMVHVKSRFKILRRIRNPEYFTYLKA